VAGREWRAYEWRRCTAVSFKLVHLKTMNELKGGYCQGERFFMDMLMAVVSMPRRSSGQIAQQRR
jgi:hypothetical protein